MTRNISLLFVLTALTVPFATGCQIVQPGSLSPECAAAQFAGQSRSAKVKINFLQLRQDPPEEYLLGPGDILGIYIEGITGSEDTPPPVHFPEKGEDIPPAVGYPIPVRDDGRISLPLVGPIYMSGATIAEAEDRIRTAYTVDNKILAPGRDRIIVTLMRRRRVHVTVIREDTETFNLNVSTGRDVLIGTAKKGKTYSVELPAYENDVLHALSESGGLPGDDAKNEIIVLRGAFADAQQQPFLLEQLQNPDTRDDFIARSMVTRIPIRVSPDTPMPPIRQEDIILHDGDVVLIEGRPTEVFYTGGLLAGGQHPLPRDYDLDVLGAIALAGGSLATSAGGQSGTLIGGGSSSNVLPATRVRILRKSEDGQQYSIEVDLRRILENDASQRVLIQPGDVVILEYRPYEVFVNTTVGWILTSSFGIFNQLF